MQDQLVKFETAKLAKEKGFNEKVFKQYQVDGYLSRVSKSIDVVIGPYEELLTPDIDCFTAPTQSLLQKWLRDVHNLHIYIDTTPVFDKMEPSKYKSTVKVPFQPFKWTTAYYYLGNTFEEALEVGLQEGLKLIKDE